VVCNSSKTEFEGGVLAGWRCWRNSDKNKYIKMSVFDVMSEVQKDSEDISAGIGIS
jgi:hypothetical protein